MRREFEKEKQRGRLRADIDLGVTAVQLTSFARGLQIQWLYNPDLPVSECLDASHNLLRVD
jgi:hypothetical protein